MLKTKEIFSLAYYSAASVVKKQHIFFSMMMKMLRVKAITQWHLEDVTVFFTFHHWGKELSCKHLKMTFGFRHIFSFFLKWKGTEKRSMNSVDLMIKRLSTKKWRHYKGHGFIKIRRPLNNFTHIFSLLCHWIDTKGILLFIHIKCPRLWRYKDGQDSPSSFGTKILSSDSNNEK